MGVNELSATWDMLVRFQRAIEENDNWSGKDIDAVSMGLMMIRNMAGQYRVQLDVAKLQAEEAKKRAKEAIKNAGGTINEQAASAANPTPLNAI